MLTSFISRIVVISPITRNHGIVVASMSAIIGQQVPMVGPLEPMVPLQVNPGVILHLSQPALPPLSHYSVGVRMPSPQTSLH